MAEKYNQFSTLNSVDCSKNAKQKGKFPYLSYALGVEIARTKGYNVTYDVVKNPLTDLSVFGNEEQGYMVLTNVSVGDRTLPMWLPIMDNKNKAIKEPNVVNINKTIMRCVAKGLAAHGVGAHIFEGYSFPCEMPVSQKTDFASLASIDVKPYVEKTYSGSEYLQWMKAIHLLLIHFPEATWEIIHCSANGELWETSPFGTMVTVSVQLSPDTKPYVIQRPVLDKKNGANMSADVCDINTALMRCLTKAISLATGLGIKLYAGEEIEEEGLSLPTSNSSSATKPSKKTSSSKATAKDEKKEEEKKEANDDATNIKKLAEKFSSLTPAQGKTILDLYKKASIEDMSPAERYNLLNNWEKAMSMVS